MLLEIGFCHRDRKSMVIYLIQKEASSKLDTPLQIKSYLNVNIDYMHISGIEPSSEMLSEHTIV